ncbi:MAG: ADP-ribosylation factor-like protein [Chloroflexota bacterium]
MMQVVNIAVLGMPGTGKSTFLTTVSNTNQSGPQGGYSARTVDEDLRLDLFESNSPLHTEILVGTALGVIVLVDSTRPQDFPMSAAYLREVGPLVGVPLLVAANKQDAPGALSAEAVQAALAIHTSHVYPVEPLCANARGSADAFLLGLLFMILDTLE